MICSASGSVPTVLMAHASMDTKMLQLLSNCSTHPEEGLSWNDLTPHFTLGTINPTVPLIQAPTDAKIPQLLSARVPTLKKKKFTMLWLDLIVDIGQKDTHSTASLGIYRYNSCPNGLSLLCTHPDDGS